jgi:four helix bundle protein
MTHINSEILYKRFLEFGLNCQKLVKSLPKTSYNLIYGNQILRSSSSPGANYIEAIEASSRKEFILKLKICRRETKESIHWLVMIKSSNEDIEEIGNECDKFIKEAQEFIRIFTSSVLTAEKNLGVESGR